MKELDLIKLGFQPRLIKGNETDPNWHYYHRSFGNRLTLLSNDSLEAAEKGWCVDFLDVENLAIKDIELLKDLISVLERIESNNAGQ